MLQYRKDIDGLRAVAVIAVILFHLNKNILPSGFIGVDIFFVISGFLITNIILNQKQNNTFTYSKFYSSRFNRIIPAYILMLLIVLLIGSILLTSNDFSYLLISFKYAFLFGSNFYFQTAGDYFSPSLYEYPLLHTWSLSIEMIFYFLWPLILMRFTHNKKNLFSLCVLILSTFIFYEFMFSAKNINYYAAFPRFMEITIGSLFAIISTSNNLKKKNILPSIVGIFLLIISFIIINEENKYPGLITLLPCIGTALFLHSNTSDSFSSKLIGNKAFIFIGKISYSLYLWHWPILAFFRYYSESYTLAPKDIVAFFISTFTLAIFSYYLIEKRIRFFFKADYINKLKNIVCYGIIFGVSIFISNKVNNYITTGVGSLSPNMGSTNLEHICHGSINKNCLQGDDLTNKNYLLIGDSHASRYNLFFNLLGKENHYSVTILTASSCVPIPKFNTNKIPEWAVPSCINMINEVKKQQSEYKNIMIAGMWSYQLQDPNYINQFTSFLNDSKTKNIIIFAQVPLLKGDLQRAIRFKYLNLPVSISKNNEYINANNQILKMVKNYKNVTFIDFNDFFDSLSDFPFIDEEPIYYDSSHLNLYGVSKMADYYKSIKLFE